MKKIINKIVTFEDLKSGRVRPEFGNPHHIAAIKIHEQRQKECKRCSGNGVIDCPDCDGEGEIKE